MDGHKGPLSTPAGILKGALQVPFTNRFATFGPNHGTMGFLPMEDNVVDTIKPRMLRLPVRIGLGYAVAIATLLLVLVITLGAFQAARHETAQVHDNYIPSLHIAKAMQIRLERMENAEFMYFVPGQPPQRWTTEFDRSAQEFGEFYVSAEAVAITAQERRIYAAIGRHLGAFLQVDEQMRNLIQAGRTDEAHRINSTESLEVAHRLREQTRAFYDLNLNETHRARAAEDTALNAALALALGTGLSGMVFAAWWWRRASHDIVAPLQTLQAASSDLAEGRIPEADHPAAAKTTELAALQADFNHMAAALQQTTARLQTTNATLEEQVASRTEALSAANRQLEALVEELRTVDKLKSDFMAVMSHELLTPINFITGFGTALEDGVMGPLTPEQVEAVKGMLDGATRLTRMVRNTLDYTQLEANKIAIHPEAIDLGEMLAWAVERIEPAVAAKHLRLLVQVPETLPPAWADPHRVDQLVEELLDNAVKFTGEGHKIRLSASATPDTVILEVADTGQGVPSEALPLLGKPFYQVDGSSTRRHGGMGLGLAIACGLAKKMGGQLRIYSRFGQGSTFQVHLPRADRITPAPTAAPSTQRPSVTNSSV